MEGWWLNKRKQVDACGTGGQGGTGKGYILSLDGTSAIFGWWRRRWKAANPWQESNSGGQGGGGKDPQVVTST